MLAILELAMCTTTRCLTEILDTANIGPSLGLFFVDWVDMRKLRPNIVYVGPVLGVEFLLCLREGNSNCWIVLAANDYDRSVFKQG